MTRRRILIALLVGFVLLAGTAAFVAIPRLGAIRCLLAFQGEVPEDLESLASPPAGFRLLENEALYGVERAWLCRNEDKDSPVIVFVHGVVPKGIADGRILRAVQAFQQGGFHVIAPEVAALVDPTKRVGDPERLVKLLHALSDGKVVPLSGRRFGVVGISVGAAAAMRACAAFRARSGTGLRAVLAIGAPDDIRRPAVQWFSLPDPAREGGESLEWKRNNAAAFARNFVLRAALKKRMGDHPDAKRLADWMADEPLPEKDPEGLESEEARSLVTWLRSDPAVRAKARERIVKEAWDQLGELSPADWADELKHLRGTGIFLMHGYGDPLVPIEEATRLEERLGQHTLVSVLRSHMVGHTTVKSVGIGERLDHVTFMDDFFDMIGR